MADLATLTESIRERVFDNVVDAQAEPPRPLYVDATYERAIRRGLARVNIDLSEDWTLATVPVKWEYMVELRGTIEMCRLRAGEGGSSLITEESGEVQSVSVPNLTVTNAVTPSRGARAWSDLCKDLEEEYGELLEAASAVLGTAATDVTVGTVVRRSILTGRHIPYEEIKALPAPSDFAVSVADGVVTVSWSPILHLRVAQYLVDRADNAAMANSERVATISDNRSGTTEDSPGAGEWHYQVTVVDDQGQKTSTVSGEVNVA